MKIEIELDEKGYCKEFKVNGETYSNGIERVLIDVQYKTEITMLGIEEMIDKKEILNNGLINFYSKK